MIVLAEFDCLISPQRARRSPAAPPAAAAAPLLTPPASPSGHQRPRPCPHPPPCVTPSRRRRWRRANLRRPPHSTGSPTSASRRPTSASSQCERLRAPARDAGLRLYGLQPHRPASDVLTVVSAAVVLSPPCGWQLAARISTTSGAVPLRGDHLRAVEARPAWGCTRQRVGVPHFLVANGALSKSSTPKRPASFRQAAVLQRPARPAFERARGMCTWRWP